MEAAEETRRLRGFHDMLRSEDKVAVDDLMRQCKLYASHASTMTSVIKEVPLIMSMIFGQHKRLLGLEEQLMKLETKSRNVTETGSCATENVLGFV